MNTAFLSLGSNLGDGRRHLEQALASLQRGGIHVDSLSRLYLTEPVGVTGQPPYLNLACGLRTELQPFELLHLCLQTERDQGRTRTARWAPRPVDIDIIFYGHWIIREPQLVVPHPRNHLRKFVLVPLCEIAPDFVDPLQGVSVRRLLAECVDLQWIRVVGAPPSIAGA